MATVAESQAAYKRSIELFLQLHALNVQGKDETDEADGIREESDGEWWKMSESQRQRLRGLSADLFTIDPNETSTHPPSGRGLAEAARAAIVSCLDHNDWEGLLIVIREHAEGIPVDLAAYYRGECWAEMGYMDAGIVFLRFACEQGRLNVIPAYAYRLLMLGRIDEAASVCERLLEAADKLWPENAFVLANCCCSLAYKVEVDKNEWLKRAIHWFAIAFKSLAEQNILEEALPGNYVALGFCHYMLGNAKEAQGACEQALKIDPERPSALFLHGLIQRGSRGKHDGSNEAWREIEKGLWIEICRGFHPSALPPHALAA